MWDWANSTEESAFGDPFRASMDAAEYLSKHGERIKACMLTAVNATIRSASADPLLTLSRAIEVTA